MEVIFYLGLAVERAEKLRVNRKETNRKENHYKTSQAERRHFQSEPNLRSGQQFGLATG